MRQHIKLRRTRQRAAAAPRNEAGNVQTTLRVPSRLYAQAKRFVGQGDSRSVNDFIVTALTAYVRAKERKAIDDAFLPMRDDLEYQREALAIAEHFAGSDAEALQIAERDLQAQR
jgi:hypothetical protein